MKNEVKCKIILQCCEIDSETITKPHCRKNTESMSSTNIWSEPRLNHLTSLGGNVFL
uniref:Uncharacterized protein n=1 Tax=Lepeophtheirus salmonis TaxID=72036 RepID=A0A0K2TPC9_LEPSM